MKRLNFSFPEETRQQLEELAQFHGGNLSDVAREAIARYHAQRFPVEEVATVIGWHPYVPARDMTDGDGNVIPAGASAWREVWSDGRIGAVLRRVDDE